MRRKLLICVGAIAIFVVFAAVAGTVIFFSALTTHYIEGDAFRSAMEDETAKGLHFPRSHYSSIRRTSPLTAHSDSFEAINGEKALKSLEAHGITARLGLLFRQFEGWLKQTFGRDH